MGQTGSQKDFSGTFTALPTPFNHDLKVDFGALGALVELQIKAGVAGIVPLGTTGEPSNVEVHERNEIVTFLVKACAGRTKVVVGAGSSSTQEAIYLTQLAVQMGADATLQVTPPCNRPNQEGLYRHFSAVADLGLPVILYNIPGRTGREIYADTVVRLAKHSKVVAIKEAGGDVDRVSAYLNACRITVLSGDDSLTIPMMAVGAKGVISVASNVVPKKMVTMVQRALAGDFVGAKRMHRQLWPLFRDLFIDSNPIPVKAALAMMGQIEEEYRLPLCPMRESFKQQLRTTLQELRLIPPHEA